ncbi:hypothetical protein DICPUDRAFT_44597 [Dictyostelium purpureum]|uniref:Importin N-terminal domain-containing protein n=1 Tax=Dictyostelium purpureum TaxID=5786 RepID=F0Z6P0_DICPU|nr:uncharacterized protein DICPUDRAFT_44597 [Dictyostelium purpureum]EGC40393.1 hypothetical protein DICPUDRAFT_44597 [Dictyostelium purpureum]|eukprot:XP_003283144.1 hypothetical protein DICPUDRAFT_44597 [Dictyostelium purpureum]
MESWQPNPAGLNQLVFLLNQSVSPSREVQDKIREELEKFHSIPDYNNYLTIIFKSAELQPHIRSVSGLLLKTNIKTYFEKMPREVQNYIKREILPVLSDSEVSVRHTVGNIVTNLIKKSNFSDWPELLPTLFQALDSQNQDLVEGSLYTISLLCEDSTKKLDSEDSNRALNQLIPKLIMFFRSTNPDFRKKALVSISFFIVQMPGALLINMEAFLKGIFSMSEDPSPQVRTNVCKTLVILVETKIEFLLPYIKDVIEYMLHATKDKSEEVALEACEFWTAISQTEGCRDLLKDYLPSLIPILLNGMVYSESDSQFLDHGDDAMTPDRPEDIKPFISQTKSHGSGAQGGDQGFVQAEQQKSEEDEEDYDDDDEDYNDFEDEEWTIRKSSAYALDVLSGIFQDAEYLSVTLPLIEQRMNDSNPWPVRESAILALGAIADGSKEGLAPHLGKVVPYLVNTLNDSKPLVRSITCWTLSRYSYWIAQEGREFLHPLVINLLNRIGDNNKKVQEAACSAFATLEEEADLLLLPYLTTILTTFVNAFSKYQAKNLLILYDAISTLAKVVGGELNKPEYVNILVPPLLQKFNSLEDNNKSLLPLLGCLNQVCSAIGIGLQNLIVLFFNRAIKLIEGSLQSQKLNEENNKRTFSSDFDFIVAALDLLQGLSEGIGTSIESLIPSSNLPRLLLECMKLRGTDVLQSSFALLGDMAKHCLIHFKQYIPEYLNILSNNLYPECLSVCNNASWAIGEIALRMPEEVKPFVPNILDRLIANINKINLNRGVLENTAVTLGRLGLVSAPDIAPNVDKFIQCWCMAIRRKTDDVEKDSAFRGMWLVINNNPNGALRHLVYICDAVASWVNMQPDLYEAYFKLLNMYKEGMGGVWPQFYSQFPAQLRQILNEKYHLDR